MDVTVTPEDAGQRLDKWLASRLEGMSRARIQTLIETGAVTAEGGTIGEANRRVKPGEVFHVNLPPPEPARVQGEEMDLAVVYEDRDVIVIDKPAGLVVHPAAGHASGTLVNALIAHCGDSLSGIGGVMRPGIVHRLDKDTSGLIVVAKNNAAHQALSEQFKSHGADGRLVRTYHALVWGVPARSEGVIDLPLARSITNRLKIAVTKGSSGRHAVTHYRVLETFAGADGKPAVSLLELQLETGRTHQIRVHLAHIGHPVLGDAVYGAGFKTRVNTLAGPALEAVAALDRQALHAAELGFEHPANGRALHFQSKFPKQLQDIMASLKAGPKPARPSVRRPATKGRSRTP
jgi:23S rRNA pseudouridine1911/1915/1917 synthase